MTTLHINIWRDERGLFVTEHKSRRDAIEDADQSPHPLTFGGTATYVETHDVPVGSGYSLASEVRSLNERRERETDPYPKSWVGSAAA